MLVGATRALLSVVTIQQTDAFLQDLAVTLHHVLLMKVISLFRAVLVDTVAKTRTPLSIMFSYFIVLHLHLYFLLCPAFQGCYLNSQLVCFVSG